MKDLAYWWLYAGAGAAFGLVWAVMAWRAYRAK
jgi:hypothetical protein